LRTATLHVEGAREEEAPLRVFSPTRYMLLPIRGCFSRNSTRRHMITLTLGTKSQARGPGPPTECKASTTFSSARMLLYAQPTFRAAVGFCSTRRTPSLIVLHLTFPSAVVGKHPQALFPQCHLRCELPHSPGEFPHPYDSQSAVRLKHPGDSNPVVASASVVCSHAPASQRCLNGAGDRNGCHASFSGDVRRFRHGPASRALATAQRQALQPRAGCSSPRRTQAEMCSARPEANREAHGQSQRFCGRRSCSPT
jgi:hypothetical protein